MGGQGSHWRSESWEDENRNPVQYLFASLFEIPGVFIPQIDLTVK